MSPSPSPQANGHVSGTKLSDYVASFVAEQGVRHVFFFPGGGAMHLNDSFGHTEGLTAVCTLHEQAAAIAAEAYARVTGNLGVCLVTTGPGGTNAVTGVSAAWLDSTPCLFLSGQVKRPDLMTDRGVRQMGCQENDIVSIVRSLTKYAVTVTEPERIRFELEKALHLARDGRPGPVWLDVPLDVQAAPIDVAALERFVPELEPMANAKEALASAVEDTIALLNGAERPVLLVGNGVRIARANELLTQIVGALGVPVLTTRLGVDLLPHDHPLCCGIPGSIASRGANFTLQNCDLLLAVGARLDLAFTAYNHEALARGARKIMVDVDPAELTKMQTPIDLPIAADARLFLQGVLDRRNHIAAKDRAPWLARCAEWKTRYPFCLPDELRRCDGISMYDFSKIVSRQLVPDDVVLPGSSGFACEIFLTVLEVKAGQRVFHNKGTGAMGFGQPAAIGACLASGGRRTICIDGDGGFQLNIQELETVRRLDLPIKFFVMNNAGFASIRASQNNYFHRLTAADATSGLTLPDTLEIARAYRLPAHRISDPNNLAEQVSQVLSQPGPSITEVVLLADEPRAPRVASTQRPDGSMVSRPLEDLWPFLPRDEFYANMIVPPLPD
ncbi:MAG: thiamine pyrophosphate-binding protein [Deltaproteobacteria bacterium]|nr:thiamine pyrophosphate-binding protein [Deltaproteobacteria bacterium]